MLAQAASNTLTVAADRPAPSALASTDSEVSLAGLPAGEADKDAYERYLLNCSDYIKRQMMIYEHWPQKRYDVLGYRNEKVFTDMNA